jgi:hypothetical protein
MQSLERALVGKCQVLVKLLYIVEAPAGTHEPGGLDELPTDPPGLTSASGAGGGSIFYLSSPVALPYLKRLISRFL